MRVLLDENVDRRLRRFLDSAFDVLTVSEQGWSGETNSEPLKAAEQEFDVLVTLDRNIQFQQDLSAYDLAVVPILARSSRRQDLEPLMPQVNTVLRRIKPRELRMVEA